MGLVLERMAMPKATPEFPVNKVGTAGDTGRDARAHHPVGVKLVARAEVGKPHVPFLCEQHVVRLDVAVNIVQPMH